MLGRSGLHISKDRRPDKMACKARTMVRRECLPGIYSMKCPSLKLGGIPQRKKAIQIGEDADGWTEEGRRDTVASLLLALTLC